MHWPILRRVSILSDRIEVRGCFFSQCSRLRRSASAPSTLSTASACCTTLLARSPGCGLSTPFSSRVTTVPCESHTPSASESASKIRIQNHPPRSDEMRSFLFGLCTKLITEVDGHGCITIYRVSVFGFRTANRADIRECAFRGWDESDGLRRARPAGDLRLPSASITSSLPEALITKPPHRPRL